MTDIDRANLELHVPEPDDDAPAATGCHWIAVGLIGFWLIVAVLLLIAFRQPVAGSVTESRLASVAVSPSEGASWSAPATTSGSASWYCKAGSSACHHAYPDRPGKADHYAAAGPRVRRMFGGDWRGRNVIVSANGRSVVVKLIDFCRCPSRVLDLYADVFARLAPLSQGVVDVRVSSRTSAIGRPVSRDKPTPTGPPTDVAR